MQSLFQNVVSSLTLCNAFWDCIHKGYADLKEYILEGSIPVCILKSSCGENPAFNVVYVLFGVFNMLYDKPCANSCIYGSGQPLTNFIVHQITLSNYKVELFWFGVC